MYSVRWFEDDKHVRVYDEEGRLVSILPSYYQAEDYLDRITAE